MGNPLEVRGTVLLCAILVATGCITGTVPSRRGLALDYDPSAAPSPRLALLSPTGMAVRTVTQGVAIQHHGGNKQVILSNGGRWHLPRGKSYRDIPAEDRLGRRTAGGREGGGGEGGPCRNLTGGVGRHRAAAKGGEGGPGQSSRATGEGG